MKSNFGKSQRNRMLAVLLSVVMVFSLGTGLTFAANEEALLDNGGISAQALGDSAQWISSTSGEGRITMTESPQTVTITFKLTNMASVQEATDAVAAGAFYLYRDKGSMPTEIYPYQFIGRGPTTGRGRTPDVTIDDAPWTLQDWKVANTNGTLSSTPLFSGYTTNVSLTGTVATVSYSFNVARFFGSATANSFRTSFLDYTGDYYFEFKDSSNIVKANTTVHLAPYDSYRTMPEIEKEINQAAAYINDPDNDREMYAEVRSLGTTEYGRNMPYIIIAKSKEAISDYEALMEREENDPTALLAELNGGYKDFQVPILYSNIHADEFNGVDSILNFMWDLAKKTRINYQTMESFTTDGAVQLAAERAAADVTYPAVFDTLAAEEKPGNLGYIRGTTAGAFNASSTSVNMSKYYNMQPTTFNVEKILDDVFFILVPEENVDGRTLSSREGYGGIDLNRDNLFQTQKETQNMTKMIAAWNPVIFWEQHGFVPDFQIEPCTPPHEANFEYDLLAKTLIGAGEAYANGAVSNNSTYNSYRMPLRDYFVDGEWDVWDDVSTAYTPEYAMLHGTVAYTVEVPAATEDGNTALEYGLINNAKFTAENKVTFLKNQVTGYERGVKNIDADTIDPWYEDINGVVGAEKDIFRPRYAENNNYFPEYYVLPNDSASQRNLKAVQEMTQWLLDSDVKVTTLTTDAAVKDANGVSRDLPAGSVVVDMHQAKRNVANVALSNGLKLKNWGTTLYSEPVTAFPEMRGFNCYAITKQDALDGKLAPLTTANTVKSATVSAPGTIIFNSSVESTRAVNALLHAGKEVGFIQSGIYKGHFIVATEDYNTVKDSYSISVRPTSILQPAKLIEDGKVFVLGAPTAEFQGTAPNFYGASEKPRIASTYYDFNYNNKALAKEMGFDVTTTDLAGAAVIAGHSGLSTAQFDAVKAGTPYVGWGTTAVSNANTLFNASNLNLGNIVSTNGTGNADALYQTEYVADSMVTAAKQYYNDEITYNYGCAYITSVPSSVDVLAKVKGTDILAGSMPASRYAGFLGSIQGFQYKNSDVDIVVYTHPLARKNHQKDDYTLISSAIFEGMTTSQDFDPGNGLEPPASSSMLEMLQFIIDWYEATFPEDDYTPGSWKPFEDALDAAKAIIAAPSDYSDNDILDAMDAIVAAELGLIFRANKTDLKSAIDYADDMLKPANIGKYHPASVANLKIALTSASAVYLDGDATQAEVDQARGDLVLAIGQMYELGDKSGLRALYTLVSRYTSGSYTPASWATFANALTAARTVLDNPNALKDPVEAAYTALANATTGLVRKADLAGLNAAIAIAQEIVDNIADYTPSTVVGLADLLASSKTVAANPNVTQAAVDAAAVALNTKILDARLKPDLSGLLSATNRAKALNAASYTEDSYKPLSTAVAGAEAILAAPDEVTKDEVSNATHAVNSAIAGLVSKADATVAGDNGKTTAPAAKTVIPKAKVLKITASAKGKIVIKWAKAPSVAKVTGYQVQYRVKGTSKWKSQTVSAKSASLTVKSLKKNKQYQFRVRAYRNNSGAKEYGAWSAVKVSKRLK